MSVTVSPHQSTWKPLYCEERIHIQDPALSDLSVLYVTSWTSRPNSSLAACLNTCSRNPSEPRPSCLIRAPSASPSLQSQEKLFLGLLFAAVSVLVLGHSHLVQRNRVQLLQRHLPLLHQVVNLLWGGKHSGFYFTQTGVLEVLQNKSMQVFPVWAGSQEEVWVSEDGEAEEKEWNDSPLTGGEHTVHVSGLHQAVVELLSDRLQLLIEARRHHQVEELLRAQLLKTQTDKPLIPPEMTSFQPQLCCGESHVTKSWWTSHMTRKPPRADSSHDSSFRSVERDTKTV